MLKEAYSFSNTAICRGKALKLRQQELHKKAGTTTDGRKVNFSSKTLYFIPLGLISAT